MADGGAICVQPPLSVIVYARPQGGITGCFPGYFWERDDFHGKYRKCMSFFIYFFMVGEIHEKCHPKRKRDVSSTF